MSTPITRRHLLVATATTVLAAHHGWLHAADKTTKSRFELATLPWDPAALEAIDKALQKSDVGVPPQNDGTVLRLQMPSMTEDRRKEIVKALGRAAEEARGALRGERRDAFEALKKSEKSKEIAEDERKRSEEAVQRLTDSYIKKVDEALAQKEKEVTTI